MPTRPTAPLASTETSSTQPALHLLGPGEPTWPGPPVDAARAVLARHARALHLDEAALQHLVVDGVHDIGRGGVIVRFRHVEHGLPVWHDALKVLLTQDLAGRAISGQLHAAAAAASPRFARGAEDAVALAMGAVLAQEFSAADVTVADVVDGAGYRAARLDDDRLRLRSLRVQPVLAPVGSFTAAAWVVELAGVVIDRHPFAWAVTVDANSGAILDRVDLRHDAAFTYRVYADVDGDHQPLNGPIGDTMPYPLDAPDGHYPGFAAANLVTIDGFNRFADPWLAPAATHTIGNNVTARTDTNIDGVGDLPAVFTTPGVFDYAADISIAAEDNDTQKMAGSTSLFYVVNWLHDWWYDSGFDEAAHNAQRGNFGRGGVENDAIDAISQYGAPQVRDNSAMAVLDDGGSPEMEMFIWSGRLVSAVTAGNDTLQASFAEFGPQAFAVSGDGVVVVDGTAPASDACQAITNDVVGKVAVIDRGDCSFSAKVLAADVAGAVGVVIVNDQAGGEGAPFMPVDPNVATSDLPVLSLSFADGAALKAALVAGPVTINLDRLQDPDRDGSLDTSVAAHEWAHYLHNRQVICQSAQCRSQGEGWGDFVALLTLVRDGDDLDGAYAVGAFAVGAFPDDPAYFGIRRFPYSTSVRKNPLTLKHIAGSAALPTTAPRAQSNNAPNNEVHAAGEVWGSMMWEATAALFTKAQQPNAALTFDETRRRLTDIVVKSMQLAPQDPTFTEMRDAILAVVATFDAESGGDDVVTVAGAFARRGAGTCAVSPERYDETFEAVAEDFAVQGNLAVTAIALDDSALSCDDDGILDAGERGTLTITVQNLSPVPAENAVVTLSSPSPSSSTSPSSVTFADDTLDIAALAPYETATLTTVVTLDKQAAAIAHTTFNARVTTGATCVADGLSITPLTNADDVDSGLATDSVEGTATSFSLAGQFAEFIWLVQPSDDALPGADWGSGNHVWFGADAPIGTDSALVTPTLRVSDDDDFVLRFRHRHHFEFDAQQNFDGAVIEISTDDGESWADLGDTVDPGYGGVIGQAQQQNNSLEGRAGFVGQSPSFPDLDVVRVDLGSAFAGEDVMLRFRIATDRGVGANGWELDDIGFDGIDNAPFSGVIENVVDCPGAGKGEGEGEAGEEGEGEGPGDVGGLRLGGGGCTGCGASSASSSSSSSSSSALAGLALFAVLLRRRRSTGC